MYESEEIIVNEDFVKRKDTYNINIGGNGGWNHLKNKPLSEEHKRKISKSRIGMKHSEETKKKLSKLGKERILSEEHKRKISESHIGMKYSKETKMKISKIHKGKIVSEETRKKISESHKKLNKMRLAS